MTPHERMMREALAEAMLAAQEGEIPVGAVVARGDTIVARAHNTREHTSDPTAHAELVALRAAAQALGTRRLDDCTLYVTLEPCPMCAGAMVMACLKGCYFGAWDEKQGCCGSVYLIPQDPAFFWHVPCTGGLLAEESKALLRAFFTERREP